MVHTDVNKLIHTIRIKTVLSLKLDQAIFTTYLQHFIKIGLAVSESSVNEYRDGIFMYKEDEIVLLSFIP